MVELLRTNDLVLISFIEALFAGEGIGCFIADQYMSAVEGSLGFLPRRILVADEQRARARQILCDAGLEEELKAGRARHENPGAALVTVDETAVAQDGNEPGDPSATEDRLLGGRLILHQPARGHRAGTDAVLLAAAVPRDAGHFIVDIGAGVGTAGLAAALRHPGSKVVLLDNDPVVAGFARQNVVLNGLAERCSVVEADVMNAITRRARGVADGSASLVLTNPPFFAPGRVRASHVAGRVRAHILVGSGSERGLAILLAAWMQGSLAVLADGGRFVMIHRPDSLEAILQAAKGRLGALRILPIYPRARADAVRIIVAGVKGSRAPLALRAGLVLHAPDNRFTALAEAIHRGEALLEC